MPRKVPKPEPKAGGNKGMGGGSSSKASGRYFEDTVTEYFDGIRGVAAKRVLGSGAFGTISNEPRLMGDVRIWWDWLVKPILAECKFGYGGSKQITIKKEWVEKISDEARKAGAYPALVVKFKGARGDNSKLIAFTWETWKEIVENLTRQIREMEVQYEGYIDTEA